VIGWMCTGKSMSTATTTADEQTNAGDSTMAVFSAALALGWFSANGPTRRRQHV